VWVFMSPTNTLQIHKRWRRSQRDG
jgi:hypothetical protein